MSSAPLHSLYSTLLRSAAPLHSAPLFTPLSPAPPLCSAPAAAKYLGRKLIAKALHKPQPVEEEEAAPAAPKSALGGLGSFLLRGAFLLGGLRLAEGALGAGRAGALGRRASGSLSFWRSGAGGSSPRVRSALLWPACPLPLTPTIAQSRVLHPASCRPEARGGAQQAVGGAQHLPHPGPGAEGPAGERSPAGPRVSTGAPWGRLGCLPVGASWGRLGCLPVGAALGRHFCRLALACASLLCWCGLVGRLRAQRLNLLAATPTPALLPARLILPASLPPSKRALPLQSCLVLAPALILVLLLTLRAEGEGGAGGEPEAGVRGAGRVYCHGGQVLRGKGGCARVNILSFQWVMVAGWAGRCIQVGA